MDKVRSEKFIDHVEIVEEKKLYGLSEMIYKRNDVEKFTGIKKEKYSGLIVIDEEY